MHEIEKFINKNKALPAGLTIASISDALEDIASREFGAKRSPLWTKTRKTHLKRQPECQACGQTDALNVHHKKPYHLRPDLECDPDNLVTLCEHSKRFGWSCHYLIGHTLDWHSSNPNVDKCIAVVRATWEED